MRKFLMILIFGFLLSFNVKAENIVVEELFGVKILDNISRYANKTDGVVQDHLKDIITFEDETLNIKRDQDFDTYYLRTDKDYKIHNITARKIFVSEFDNFNNDCLNQKSTMVNMLSKFFDIKENKFMNYSWLDPRTKALYDDSTLKYKDNNISLILSSYCGYFNIEEKLYSVLFVSWVTEDYHKKHVDGRWTKIESFDDNFIKVFLSKES
jgi:hypothetical protein